MLSQRVLSLSPSATLALDGQVKQLQAQGIKIINLGVGESDMATAAHIAAAGITAIREGFTHYTATAGILPLRQAIAHQLQTKNHLRYDPAEIVVGVGKVKLPRAIGFTAAMSRTQPAWKEILQDVTLLKNTSESLWARKSRNTSPIASLPMLFTSTWAIVWM